MRELVVEHEREREKEMTPRDAVQSTSLEMHRKVLVNAVFKLTGWETIDMFPFTQTLGMRFSTDT